MNAVMNPFDERKLLVERILSYLTNPPSATVQNLMQKSVSELETILGDVVTRNVRAEANGQANQYAAEMRRESKLDGAWVHALLQICLNGKRLADIESNRQLLESMLHPHEEPSAAIYKTIVLSNPTKFSWEFPAKTLTDAERRADFEKFCRENSLSLCAANEQLHKHGVGIEHWAGASQVELQKFQAQAAQSRQRFLIHDASPQQLKEEARYQSQIQREEAQRVESERRHEYVLRQQSHYPSLPLSANGEAWDASFLRRISTTNYPLFKQIVKKYGCGNVTERLRGGD